MNKNVQQYSTKKSFEFICLFINNPFLKILALLDCINKLNLADDEASLFINKIASSGKYITNTDIELISNSIKPILAIKKTLANLICEFMATTKNEYYKALLTNFSKQESLKLENNDINDITSILGSWGAGKSTVKMNIIEILKAYTNYDIVNYEAFQFEKPEQVISSLYRVSGDSIRNKNCKNILGNDFMAMAQLKNEEQAKSISTSIIFSSILLVTVAYLLTKLSPHLNDIIQFFNGKTSDEVIFWFKFVPCAVFVLTCLIYRNNFLNSSRRFCRTDLILM